MLLLKRPIGIRPQRDLEVFPLLVVSGCSVEAETLGIVQGRQVPLDESFAAPLLHTDTAVGIANRAGVASVPDSERVDPLFSLWINNPGIHVVSPGVTFGQKGPLGGRLLDVGVLEAR